MKKQAHWWLVIDRQTGWVMHHSNSREWAREWRSMWLDRVRDGRIVKVVRATSTKRPNSTGEPV